jgi:hypothetical protein
MKSEPNNKGGIKFENCFKFEREKMTTLMNSSLNENSLIEKMDSTQQT